MKFTINILLIGLCSLIGQLFAPFWIVLPISFLIGMLNGLSASKAFFAGFIGSGLLWFIAAYILDQNTSSLLTEKIAAIFYANTIIILCITSFIGGLLGGFGSLTGKLFYKTIKR